MTLNQAVNNTFLPIMYIIMFKAHKIKQANLQYKQQTASRL